MEITLYELPGCPFCAKVRNYMEEKNIEHTVVDVVRDREDPKRKEIAEASGVATVPVICADGTWVGDSDAIIAWLEENA